MELKSSRARELPHKCFICGDKIKSVYNLEYEVHELNYTYHGGNYYHVGCFARKKRISGGL